MKADSMDDDLEAHILNYLGRPSHHATNRWRMFIENQFVPTNLYEIGANNPFTPEGQQTVLKPLMPDTQFFLIEACQKHEQALIDSGEKYAIEVLGLRDGDTKTFYETRDFPQGTGDSLYIELTNFYTPDVRIERQVVTKRLDTLVQERGWPVPDFIRIDTQGSELDILQGATAFLDQVRGIQIECSIQQYNKGAPLLPEAVWFMHLNGFRLYDIGQMQFNSVREVMHVDLIFVQSDLFKDRWMNFNS